VECIVRHSDGAAESLQLKHSYSLQQVDWFHAGSALNLVREPRSEVTMS
jgi:aconitate hydratase